MEIDLDLAFIQDVLAKEGVAASAELQELGALGALERSQQRHDSRIAAAPDVGTLACRAGCTWCCYFTVDVRAVEVFRILDVVEGTFAEGDKARVYSEIRQNAATLRNLDETARVTRNVKCPFLHEGRCSIYAARPQSCRNYHATDVAGCQASYEDPGNLEIDPEFAPMVYQAGAAHVEAFSIAMGNAGFDASAYELNCALDEAMRDPGALGRFEAGGEPFTDLEGEEVPLEFDDLEGE
jgi:Fe-S-cluster containining protein